MQHHPGTPAQAKGYRALVVDDELPLAEVVASYLEREQFEAVVAGNGADAIAVARDLDPDVVILDLGLPGIDGLEVCRQLRTFSDAYVVMLTARDTEMDTVLGLTVGADDYIIKPFDPAEVVARVRARLRGPRVAPRGGDSARFAGWTAHFDRYALEDETGTETTFSHAEGEVLRLFLESPKRLITRAHMQESLGGAAGESFDRAMDVRISRLRTKLREDPKTPRLIKTIYGAGYIFLGDVSWS